MPYQFPPDIAQRVRAQVESGQFETEDDVLREAIDTLESRQRGRQQLRKMVQEADGDIAAGRVGPFNADATKRAVRKRLEENGITDHLARVAPVRETSSERTYEGTARTID